LGNEFENYKIRLRKVNKQCPQDAAAISSALAGLIKLLLNSLLFHLECSAFNIFFKGSKKQCMSLLPTNEFVLYPTRISFHFWGNGRITAFGICFGR
jgi:hypothetical protein